MMDDTISRQAAIDAVTKYCIKNDLRELLANIECLPTAEPRKGKWIKDSLCSTNGGAYGVWRCSECEHYYQDVGYGFNYCPNCGARMEGYK